MLDNAERILDGYREGRISRREAALVLLGLAAAPLGAVPGGDSEGPGEPTFRASGLNHFGLRVSDVARSRDFYQRHLGLSIIRDNAPGNCFLAAGHHYMGLFRASTPELDHFAFTVEGYDADRAMASCREAGLEPRRIEDRVYFDDPDGLELQVDSPFGSWPGPAPAP